MKYVIVNLNTSRYYSNLFPNFVKSWKNAKTWDNQKEARISLTELKRLHPKAEFSVGRLHFDVTLEIGF